MKQTKTYLFLASIIILGGLTVSLTILSLNSPNSAQAQEDEPAELPGECLNQATVPTIIVQKLEETPELPEEIAYPNQFGTSPLLVFVHTNFGSGQFNPVHNYEVRYYDEYELDQFSPNYVFNMYDYWCDEYTPPGPFGNFSCASGQYGGEFGPPDGFPDGLPDDFLEIIDGGHLDEDGNLGPYGVQNAEWTSDFVSFGNGLFLFPSSQAQEECLEAVQDEWFPFFGGGDGTPGSGGWNMSVAPSFGGRVVSAIPCLCSNTWNVQVTPPGHNTGVYTHVPGMGQFANGRLSVPPGYWVLGLYAPGVACYQYAGTTCVAVPSQGIISPIVGTSAF